MEHFMTCSFDETKLAQENQNFPHPSMLVVQMLADKIALEPPFVKAAFSAEKNRSVEMMNSDCSAAF
jgi:hypothetical protein